MLDITAYLVSVGSRTTKQIALLIIINADDSIYRQKILIIDSNSQRNYITRKLAGRLKLETKNSHILQTFLEITKPKRLLHQ